jgi:hypothetical protein
MYKLDVDMEPNIIYNKITVLLWGTQSRDNRLSGVSYSYSEFVQPLRSAKHINLVLVLRLGPVQVKSQISGGSVYVVSR